MHHVLADVYPRWDVLKPNFASFSYALRQLIVFQDKGRPFSKFIWCMDTSDHGDVHQAWLCKLHPLFAEPSNFLIYMLNVMGKLVESLSLMFCLLYVSIINFMLTLLFTRQRDLENGFQACFVRTSPVTTDNCPAEFCSLINWFIYGKGSSVNPFNICADTTYWI